MNDSMEAKLMSAIEKYWDVLPINFKSEIETILEQDDEEKMREYYSENQTSIGDAYK